MSNATATDGPRSAGSLMSWLGRVFAGDGAVNAVKAKPAATRSEVAQWLAESIATDLREARPKISEAEVSMPALASVRSALPKLQTTPA